MHVAEVETIIPVHYRHTFVNTLSYIAMVYKGTEERVVHKMM